MDNARDHLSGRVLCSGLSILVFVEIDMGHVEADLAKYQYEQDQDDLSHELFGDRVLGDLKYELLSGSFIDTTSWGKKVDLHFILDGEDFTDWIVKLALAQDYADVAMEIRDHVEQKVEAYLRSDPAAPIIAERVRELVMERG